MLVHCTQYTAHWTLHTVHLCLLLIAFNAEEWWSILLGVHCSPLTEGLHCFALYYTTLHCIAQHSSATQCNRLYICTKLYAMLYLLWSVCVACMSDVSGQGRAKNLHRLGEVRYKQTDTHVMVWCGSYHHNKCVPESRLYDKHTKEDGRCAGRYLWSQVERLIM